MRLTQVFFAALGCLAPLSVCADEFSEFRIPKHRASQWTLNLDAGADRDAFNSPGIEAKRSIGNGAFSTRAFWMTDSDTSRTVLSGAGSVGGTRQTNDNGPATAASQGKRQSRNVDEQWFLSLEHRRYPWQVPMGFEGFVTGRGDYSQRWEKSAVTEPTLEGHNFTFDSADTWAHWTEIEVQAALGWGRVRDATGVFEARAMEERLRRSGLLSRPLSASARTRLAELMYTRAALDRVADRPARFLWEAVGNVVRNDGALGEAASDPGAWARAFEPYIGATRINTSDLVPSAPQPRLSGHFIAPLVRYSHSSNGAHGDVTHHAEYYQGDSLVLVTSNSGPVVFSGTGNDELLVGVEGEWHRPLDMNWQVDVVAMGAVPADDAANQFVFDSDAEIGYLVPDRWSGGITGSYARAIQDQDATIAGKLTGTGWATSVGAFLEFYLEDHVALSLSVNDNQQRQMISGFNPQELFFSRRASSARLTLTYRLAGGFSAPGLLTPTLGRAGMR